MINGFETLFSEMLNMKFEQNEWNYFRVNRKHISSDSVS